MERKIVISLAGEPKEMETKFGITGNNHIRKFKTTHK